MNTAFPTKVLDPDLLIRPHPGRTEGPLGYRLRLAEANFMTPHDISQMGFGYKRSWLLEQRLAPPQEVDPDLHVHIARMAGFLKDSQRIWNPRHPRFCPLCLAEEPAWQAAWEILFFDACPRHGVWLVDQCSSCGEPLRWNRDALLRCHCGADLRQESSGAAPDNLSHLSSILEALLLGREIQDATPPLAGLDLEQGQRLIRYLGGHMDPAAVSRPLKLRNAGRLQTSWPVTTLAAEILSHWPQSFHECWSRLQDNSPGGKSGLMGAFRQAYHYLYKGLPEGAFLPVRESFETWLGEHWKGGLCKRNRRLSSELLAKAQWIPGKVAADKLGISVPRLRTLVSEGMLEGQESVSTTGRHFLMVRKDQLEQINLQLANEMTMTAAMEAIGLSKIRMRRLLRLLFPNAKRINGKEKMPWCVPRNDVEALQAIGSHLPVVSIPEEDHVSLTYVLKHWAWTAEEIVALVEAVKAGKIPLISMLDSGRGINRWVLEAKQLRAWQASLHAGLEQYSWLSIPDAARVMNVKQQVAYWLTKNGYLPVSDKIATSKRSGARVRREDIEWFMNHYVFGREIAAQIGRSSRTVTRLLAEQGIYPLKGHTPEPCRLSVFKRDEGIRRFLMLINGASGAELKLVGN